MYLERLGLRAVRVEEVLPDPRGYEGDPFRSGIPDICGICGIRSRPCNTGITEDAVGELSADLRTDAVHLCALPPRSGYPFNFARTPAAPLLAVHAVETVITTTRTKTPNERG